VAVRELKTEQLPEVKGETSTLSEAAVSHLITMIIKKINNLKKYKNEKTKPNEQACF
jgi:hypothetical protein